MKPATDFTTEAAPSGTIRPADTLRGLTPYAPPPAAAADVLRLDANEAPQPGSGVCGSLAALPPEALSRYPSTAALEARLADRYGVGAERVVVTNGGDDAIDRLCRAVLMPGRLALCHSPSFEMIWRSIRLAGGAIEAEPWLDGAFPVDGMLARIRAGVSLVSLVTPNNPTGGVIDLSSIENIARSAAEVGALVLVDLAYVEFAENDPTPDLLRLPNVAIVRTFSKAFGLAGARVGYTLASAEVCGWLRTVGGPYPVSAPSLALASAALDAAEERAWLIDAVRGERIAFTSLLDELGFVALPSEGNFVLARVPDAAELHRELLRLGVAVRRYPDESELAGVLRITLPGCQASYERLENALRQAAIGLQRISGQLGRGGSTP